MRDDIVITGRFEVPSVQKFIIAILMVKRKEKKKLEKNIQIVTKEVNNSGMRIKVLLNKIQKKIKNNDNMQLNGSNLL
jgi:hypothetical protein